MKRALYDFNGWQAMHLSDKERCSQDPPHVRVGLLLCYSHPFGCTSKKTCNRKSSKKERCSGSVNRRPLVLKRQTERKNSVEVPMDVNATSIL